MQWSSMPKIENDTEANLYAANGIHHKLRNISENETQ